jgi:hypothetical protein
VHAFFGHYIVSIGLNPYSFTHINKMTLISFIHVLFRVEKKVTIIMSLRCSNRIFVSLGSLLLLQIKRNWRFIAIAAIRTYDLISLCGCTRNMPVAGRATAALSSTTFSYLRHGWQNRDRLNDS